MLMFLSKRADMPTSQKDIAESFEISAAAVAVAVKKLEDEGFIIRVHDERDSRTNILVLTERGQRIVAETTDIIEELDSAMFDGFDEHEIADFSKYLSRLLENIKSFK